MSHNREPILSARHVKKFSPNEREGLAGQLTLIGVICQVKHGKNRNWPFQISIMLSQCFLGHTKAQELLLLF